MKKLLLASTLLVLTSNGYGQDLTNQEILQKLKLLEEKVNQLEKENRELKALLSKFYVASGRKRDKSLKVGGRILFRFSQTQDIDEAKGKSVYGDTSNGFSVRKARFYVKGELSDNFKYKIQIRADRGSVVELWDAYGIYSFDSLPLSIKFGQFKVPLSMSYLKSGTKLSFPERPVTVNKIAPVWRDVGVALSYKFLKDYSITGAILNGDGWSSGKIANADRRYAYVVAFSGTPLKTADYDLKFRIGGELGRDSAQKLIYSKYGAKSVKRHLLDGEVSLKIKPFGLTLEGGYLHDNPTNKKVKLGNAKGYYLQGDYAVPFDSKLHLVARYSYVDPNTDKDDKYDVDYTTVGAYYLIDGWQAAIRTSYTFANQRKTKEIDDNLFTAELQLLF